MCSRRPASSDAVFRAASSFGRIRSATAASSLWARSRSAKAGASSPFSQPATVSSVGTAGGFTRSVRKRRASAGFARNVRTAPK